MEKDCKSCKHDGNQMFFRTACTGCGVDDIQYQHWEAKTERNPNAESVSANPLLSDVADLKPCPFCGSKEVYLTENDFDGNYVVCDACLCRTSGWPNKQDCINDWNKRV